MQSTIKSITPKLDENGFQKTWPGMGGKIMYDLVVEFEDGTKGDVSSIKPQGNYQIGDTVLYTKSENNRSTNNTKVKIEKKADVVGNGNGSKSTYNDPSVVKKMALSVCQGLAIKMFLNAKVEPQAESHIFALSEWFFAWVLGNISSSEPGYRDIISRRWYALTSAVECVQFLNLGINKKEDVIELASRLLDQVNNQDNGNKPA